HPRETSHHSLHIDLFPLIGLPENKIMQRIFVEKSYLLNKIYYIKKINHKILYKNRPKRRLQAILLKILLLPISERIIKNKINELATRYNYKESSYVYTLGGSYKMREVFPKIVYDDLIRTEFEEMKLPILRDYKFYLTQIYGSDYMTPKKTNYL